MKGKYQLPVAKHRERGSHKVRCAESSPQAIREISNAAVNYSMRNFQLLIGSHRCSENLPRYAARKDERQYYLLSLLLPYSGYIYRACLDIAIDAVPHRLRHKVEHFLSNFEDDDHRRVKSYNERVLGLILTWKLTGSVLQRFVLV